MTDAERARIRQAIFDWVRNDCGAAIKMTLTGPQIDRLLDRICNPAPQKPEKPSTVVKMRSKGK